MIVVVNIMNPDPNMRLLVANRGEIARRIFRSAHAWGVVTIAVYADPDADAPFVREASSAEHIGPVSLAESYLSIDAILAAAERARATHVHPGYGFLAERPEFARRVVDAGLIWVGPQPDAIDAMGSKINARAIAIAAGVAVIPGFNDSQDDEELARAADRIGYPVLIKASAGGGGKGIRVASEPDEFARALGAARDEAMRSFGDDAMIVERYVMNPRHIEVQVAGDRHGNTIDLGTRECSVQRRYQKLFEEAPAPHLSPDTASAIRAAAVRLASAIGYDSVGTVEFVVDSATNEHFFLEMNTRIQVEHTVTEQITGVDLVHLQLALAGGGQLPLAADTFDSAHGHAIEVRINAEDPWNDHLPQTGQVETLSVPTGDQLRWDGAIEAGSEISPHYDSMIGKLIVTADDRSEALQLMAEALTDLRIDGPVTNIDLHRWLLEQPEVRFGTVTTRFLDETALPMRSPYDTAATATPWASRIGRRFTPHRGAFAFDAPSRDTRWHEQAVHAGSASDIRAPFPGLITEIHFSPDDEVTHGQHLLTIEAMKMLHPLLCDGHGIVANVHVSVGDQVATADPLMTFHSPDSTGDSP